MRIATDLHDDIGSNLSEISLLSEIVNLKLAGDGENSRLLNLIAQISRRSVASMSDIVWAINPHRDSILEMRRRMRQHAEEIFVERGVSVAFNAPTDRKKIRLSMDRRRELFLIFKEAINNAAKHSGCTRIEIDLSVRGAEIFLRITDNGRGFDISEGSDGNGLANMRERAESRGGKFEIESQIGSGTAIKIRFPLV
jgi:signal transduction histidine kinase